MKNFDKILIIIVISILVSCKGMVKEFQTMNKLHDTLTRKYATKEISINITNGKYLHVSIVNSKFNKLQSEEKQKMAYEIGEIVLKVMGKESKIESGKLVFVDKNNYVVVNTSKSESFDMQLESLYKGPVNDTLHKPN